MKLWCENQMEDKNGCLICCAHLAEGRAFNCPYKNNEIRKQSKYPCSDYKVIDNSI